MLKSIYLVSVISVGLISALSAQDTALFLSGGSGVTGDSITSHITLDSAVEVQGWSMGICHDTANLDVTAAQDGPTTMIVNGGGPPDFNELNVLPDGVTVGVVISFVGSNALASGTGYGLLDIDYLLTGVPDAGGFPIDAPVSFCNTLGAPAVDVVIVSGGASLIPDQTNAFIQIIPPPDFCLDLSCEGGVTDSILTWNECTPFDYVLVHRDGDLIAMLDAGITEVMSSSWNHSIGSDRDDLGLADGTDHLRGAGCIRKNNSE